MAARLKVFATRIGFHDVIVAAPSQKAALAAWDVRENLFAQGAARVIDDAAATKAALASPGVVLSRAIGETGAYHAEPKTPTRPPPAARPKAVGGAKSAAPKAKPKPKPKPDRRPLDAAQAALDALESEQRQALAQIERERRALEARADGVERSFATRRRPLETERDRAQRVYEAAGGR